MKKSKEAKMSKRRKGHDKEVKDSGSGLCCDYCSLSKYPCANMERIEKGRAKEKKIDKEDG